MNEIFGKKYKTCELIGNGSFGEIYKCKNIETKQNLAIKLERIDANYPQLENEYNVYKELQGEEHVPKIYDFGSTKTHKYLVMDALGSSIDCAFDDCGQKFSPKTVLMLAAQMITCVETLHRHKYIHRDIKPDNFIMGLGEKSRTVLIIDMGLSKRYVTDDNEHVPMLDGRGFSGTVRYASINALMGITPSRRDDLEALGYVWVFLMKGKLPWSYLEKEKNLPNRYMQYAECKKKHVLTDLCDGLPQELKMYFRTVLQLEFEEEPDYSFLRSIVIQALANYGTKIDFVYDWTKKSSRKKNKSKDPKERESKKKSVSGNDTEEKEKSKVRRTRKVHAKSSDTKQRMILKKNISKRKCLKQVKSNEGFIIEKKAVKKSPLISGSSGNILIKTNGKAAEE